jgi:ribosome-associated protein
MTESISFPSEIHKKILAPVFERKTKSVTAIDVSQLTSYTDTLVIIEVNSNRQVSSIAEHVIKALKKLKIKSMGIEGVREGQWALLDYGDIIFHVFNSETKAFYDLEGFWADAPRMDLSCFETKS